MKAAAPKKALRAERAWYVHLYVAEIAGRATFAFDADSENQADGYLWTNHSQATSTSSRVAAVRYGTANLKSGWGQPYLMRQLSGTPATVLPMSRRRRFHGYSSYRLSIR